MVSANKTFILIDESKIVSKLGEKYPIPIECYPNSMLYVKEKLFQMGAKEIKLRKAVAKDGPVITENGNFILDTKFKVINENLEKQIKCISGVIETGLFIGYDIEIMKN